MKESEAKTILEAPVLEVPIRPTLDMRVDREYLHKHAPASVDRIYIVPKGEEHGMAILFYHERGGSCPLCRGSRSRGVLTPERVRPWVHPDRRDDMGVRELLTLPVNTRRETGAYTLSGISRAITREIENGRIPHGWGLPTHRAYSWDICFLMGIPVIHARFSSACWVLSEDDIDWESSCYGSKPSDSKFRAFHELAITNVFSPAEEDCGELDA